MSNPKNCVKGYPCRKTCIEKTDKCNNELPEAVHKVLGKFYENVQKVGKFDADLITKTFNEKKALSKTQTVALEKLEGLISSGKISDDVITGITNFVVGNILYSEPPKGSKMAPLEDMKALTDKGTFDKEPNKSRIDLVTDAITASTKDKTFDPSAPGGVKDYIDKVVKLTEVPDEVVDVVFDMMGSKYQQKFKSAGMGTNRPAWTGYANEEKTENTYSLKERPTVRGKAGVKRYLEQKGIDPYTGNVIPFNNAELEHISPLGKSKDGNGNKNGDQPDNWAWVDGGLNRSHGELSPEAWLKNAETAISDPEAYQQLYDKKKAESDSKQAKISGVGNVIKEALAHDDAGMRMELIYSYGKSLGSKSKKLVETSGDSLLVPESIKMSYIKLQKSTGKNSPTLDRTNVPELKEWGNPKVKPSEIMAMTLAALDDNSKRSFVEDYKKNMSNNWAGDFTNADTHKALLERVGHEEYSRLLEENVSRYNTGLNEVLNKYNVKIGDSDIKTKINSLANTPKKK